MRKEPGWHPVPFRSFVLKIHARCNLRCDYCYMYTMADQRWRLRPRVMSRATIDAVAFRIAEHARAHDIANVDVVLHGGEPLLAGPEVIAHVVNSVRAALGSQSRAQMSIQTNGLLLDHNYLELLAELDVKVGLSLDGDRATHDRHRRGRDGTGSYGMVAAAAERLAGYPGLFSRSSSLRYANSCSASPRPLSTSCCRTGTGRRLRLDARSTMPRTPMGPG